MSDANPFDDHALHAPPFEADDARDLATRLYGRRGEIRELGSHQDRNYRIDDGSGERAVLKIANSVFTHDEIDLQNAAMRHVAAANPGFEVPRVIASLDGREIEAVERDGVTYMVRLVTYVEGEPLFAVRYHHPRVLRALGRMAARSALSLADFDHPAADRLIQWDLRHARDVVAALLAYCRPERRERAELAIDRFAAVVDPLRESLPQTVVHADLTDLNILGRRDRAGRLQPAAVIDYGDTVRTWVASELAILIASLLPYDRDRLLAVETEMVRGFDEVRPLSDAELAAMHPLVLARAASAAVSGEQQAQLDPDNPYATAVGETDFQILEMALSIPDALAEASFRAACGRDPIARRPPARGVWPLPSSAPGEAAADLSADGDWAFGEWLDPLASGRSRGAFTCHGERRIAASDRNAATEPATVHLGVDLAATPGDTVVAPVGGEIVRVGERDVVLRCDDDGAPYVRLAGLASTVASGARVASGATLGTIRDEPHRLGPHLHVQRLAWLPDVVPGLVRPHEAAAWLDLSPDPAALLGLPQHEVLDADLLADRRRLIADAQILYYEEPREIVRGYREHLYDADGRPYLDVVNNVAVLGHAHPIVTAAATEQLERLNTNSRFLYRPMMRYAERLTALLPDGLDQVFLVSSGSEAVDLALRLARTYTGRRATIAVDGAYHGWTGWTYEIASSPFDNPDAAATMPPYVFPVPQPNTYRGPYGADDPDAGERYAADVVRAVARAAEQGGIAAFVFEALLGNQGGLVIPAGYLETAYAAVRAAGGVCIADEIQVGYGRLGHHFWAFEQQCVVPDIVTIAKATGNGHPVAAVITRREIADAFAARASFFSSVGGSPVSCAVALAVLDTIEREELQRNARDVGDRLGAELEELAERHALIGAVHGMGLYRGVDLVRDRVTKEPASDEAYALCERMRELGVIVQPTGDFENVLKLKPPLCISHASAAYFAATLDRVLSDGW